MRKPTLGSFTLPAMAALAAALSATAVFGQELIVRPYQSVRSAGMGNVRYTTGLYEDNFFANPARVTANPTWKITLMDPTVEFSTNVPGTVSDIAGGGSQFYKSLGKEAGNNNHARIQTTLPGFFWGHGKWSYGLALITSTQADINLRRSYNIDPLVITDIGPAATVGRKFLDENELSVGLTTHAVYRLSTNQNYSFVQLIQGKSLSPSSTGGQGAMVDFDLGTTYDFHWHPLGMNLQAGAAINNVLGGKYSNLSFKPISSITTLPTQQPRTYNLGASASKASIGILHDTTAAFEVTDFNNNTNGSLFRLLHLGGETHLSILAARLGINQGYLAAGLGVDLKVFTVDFATYGEELGLNAGDLEDRRYAIRLAIQI